MASSAQWKVIHIARNEDSARDSRRFLEEESFLVRFRRIASGAAGGDCYEILTLSTEADDARQLLIDHNFLR